MSEVKCYDIAEYGGGVVESKDGERVDYSAYDDAQSELAALREELADCRFMLEANSKQVDRLIEEKAELRRDADKILKHRSEQRDDAQQRLTAAEQRNASLEKDLGKVQSLARRTLWLAYCWNDHNFREAHTYAQTAAELSGIKNFEEANKFIESWAQPTESGASE